MERDQFLLQDTVGSRIGMLQRILPVQKRVLNSELVQNTAVQPEIQWIFH